MVQEGLPEFTGLVPVAPMEDAPLVPMIPSDLPKSKGEIPASATSPIRQPEQDNTVMKSDSKTLLPNTGSESQDWLSVLGMLNLLGLGGLVLSKSNKKKDSY